MAGQPETPQTTVEGLERAIDYGRQGKELADSLEARMGSFRQLASETRDPYQLEFYKGELDKCSTDHRVYAGWQELSGRTLGGATVDVYGLLLEKYKLPKIKAAEAYKGKRLAELLNAKGKDDKPDKLAQDVGQLLLRVADQIGKARKENAGLAALKAEIEAINAQGGGA